MTMTTTDYSSLFRVRTVTCFVTLEEDSYQLLDSDGQIHWADSRMQDAVDLLRKVETSLVNSGYTVQTVRLATNSFGSWLPTKSTGTSTPSHDISQIEKVLRALDQWLEEKEISFCSLGSAESIYEVEEICPLIVRTSSRFSCSANLTATDVARAKACGRAIRQIAYTTEPAAYMQDGLGNFRFAVALCCPPLIPFFPVAKAPQQNGLTFAVGLENGSLAQELLKQCESIQNVPTIFQQGMADALLPIQEICQKFESDNKIVYAGIDTSLNPSLDATGSVAAALESLKEVSSSWGGPGTLAVAAALTKSLQSLPNIRRTGYCGIMLPVCEDARLAELTENNQLRLAELLSISSVCGVGIDTVPLSGEVTEDALAALALDVAGLADRWQKPLSCRVFPLPGKTSGKLTTFDFPHMMNAVILPLAHEPK